MSAYPPAPHARPYHTLVLRLRSQTIEIIVALKKLGEALTAGEKAFLKQHDDAMAQFESADKAIDASMVSGAVSGAAAGQ